MRGISSFAERQPAYVRVGRFDAEGRLLLLTIAFGGQCEEGQVCDAGESTVKAEG